MATRFKPDYLTSSQPPADPDAIDKAPPMEDRQDANTVSTPNRLQGAKGLSYLKSRST